MLRTGAADMGEIRLHPSTQARPAPTETSRRERDATVMPGRIESRNSDIARTFGRRQQSIIARVDEVRERSGRVAGA